MILVDTSVWVDHLRSPEPDMIEQLNANNVMVHPFVIGELACGMLPDRAEVLRRLTLLPQIEQAAQDDVLSTIESMGLMGSGIGFIDAHLLCSVVGSSGVSLWTRDQRLSRIATELGLAYPRFALIGG